MASWAIGILLYVVSGPLLSKWSVGSGTIDGGYKSRALRDISRGKVESKLVLIGLFRLMKSSLKRSRSSRFSVSRCDMLVRAVAAFPGAASGTDDHATGNTGHSGLRKG